MLLGRIRLILISTELKKPFLHDGLGIHHFAHMRQATISLFSLYRFSLFDIFKDFRSSFLCVRKFCECSQMPHTITVSVTRAHYFTILRSIECELFYLRIRFIESSKTTEKITTESLLYFVHLTRSLPRLLVSP